MKLAALLESQRAKKAAGVIIRHRKSLGVVLYVVGLAYLSQLPRDELNHRSFIDENALMTGLVKREFNSPQTISNYANQLETVYHDQEELIDWLGGAFAGIGLEVYEQNYSATRPAVIQHQPVTVSGRNVYAILRAGRSSSAESLVFSAPYLSPSPSHSGSQTLTNHHGLAVMLSLAEYFKSKSYWAKDIIFLVTTGDEIGAQAWINSYMGDTAKGIVSGPLPGRSGAVQAVINLELNSSQLEYAGLVIEGVNGILPNLDLVHVVTHLSEMEGIPSALHVQWENVRQRGRYSTDTSRSYTSKLLTVASLLAHQAPGLPLANHALFLRHRIDSVTVRGMGSGHNAKPLKNLARALEGSFRSLNNLLERLHHSEFFYYAPSRGRFISIGQFMPTLAPLLAPLVLEALACWLLARGFTPSPSGGGIIQSSQSPVFPFHAVLSLILPSFLSGVLLLSLPALVAVLQSPLTPPSLAAALVWGVCLSVFTPLFSSSSVPVSSWHMAKCFSLIFQLLLLLAMAIMNYSLVVCLILSLPLPAILSQPYRPHGGRLRHRLGQLLLLLFSPPLSLLYLCCAYHALSSVSLLTHDTATLDVAAMLEGGVGVAGRGLVLAYNSWHFVGSWLFPVGCLVVWPLWGMGWRLACQSVSEGEEEEEGGDKTAETDSSSSHPHSD